MTLPIIVVSDAVYADLRTRLGIEPSPSAVVFERRRVNLPVVYDRRMPAEFEPVEE